MNHDHRLRERLVKQLSFIDDNRMPMLDTYFPHDRYGYHERERYNKFFDHYVSTVEKMIAQLDGTNNATTISQVLIGSEVSVFYTQYNDEDTITICFPEKANPDLGHVSFLSPLAWQILLCRVDDSVHLNTPQGETSVTIREIKFIDW